MTDDHLDQSRREFLMKYPLTDEQFRKIESVVQNKTYKAGIILSKVRVEDQEAFRFLLSRRFIMNVSQFAAVYSQGNLFYFASDEAEIIRQIREENDRAVAEVTNKNHIEKRNFRVGLSTLVISIFSFLLAFADQIRIFLS